MCGRMTQQRPTSELAEIFEAEDLVAAPGGRFNVAPTDEAAVVVQREDKRAITAYRWGLIPHWSESPKTGNKMFNARAESLDRNPAFRYAFQKRRCLIPADAFYEWRREGKVRQPFAVMRRDGRPMAFAGLWAGWKDEDTGEIIRSFTIVTTEANDLVGEIHNRMPVVVPESAWDTWLDPTLTAPGELAELKSLLVPAEEGWLETYPVSRRVNDVRNDGPDLVEPLGEDGSDPGTSGEGSRANEDAEEARRQPTLGLEEAPSTDEGGPNSR
jgi:putative SOS response-associated peptidase YedK